MQPTERGHFDEQIALLCAGFNVPCTEERREAYWKGLAKMPLGSFARSVEYALGEYGPERIPTVPQLWTINRAAKAARPDARTGQPTAKIAAFDSIHSYGQRRLLAFLMEPKRATPSDASLQRMIAGKNRIIDQYRQIEREEPVESSEIEAALEREFLKLYEPMPEHERTAARERFKATGNACGRAA